MQLFKRSSHHLPLILGMLLIFTPFVYGIMTFSSGFLAAWILGAVVSLTAVVLGLLWLGFPRNSVTEGLTMVMGLVLFMTPWLLSYTWLNAGTLASSLLGAFLMIAAGGMLEQDWSRRARPAIYRDSVASTDYRRVSSHL